MVNGGKHSERGPRMSCLLYVLVTLQFWGAFSTKPDQALNTRTEEGQTESPRRLLRIKVYKYAAHTTCAQHAKATCFREHTLLLFLSFCLEFSSDRTCRCQSLSLPPLPPPLSH
jgi:hypothetical protein